jgi:hypothetical protein
MFAQYKSVKRSIDVRVFRILLLYKCLFFVLCSQSAVLTDSEL